LGDQLTDFATIVGNKDTFNQAYFSSLSKERPEPALREAAELTGSLAQSALELVKRRQGRHAVKKSFERMGCGHAAA